MLTQTCNQEHNTIKGEIVSVFLKHIITLSVSSYLGYTSSHYFFSRLDLVARLTLLLCFCLQSLYLTPRLCALLKII